MKLKVLYLLYQDFQHLQILKKGFFVASIIKNMINTIKFVSIETIYKQIMVFLKIMQQNNIR